MPNGLAGRDRGHFSFWGKGKDQLALVKMDAIAILKYLSQRRRSIEHERDVFLVGNQIIFIHGLDDGAKEWRHIWLIDHDARLGAPADGGSFIMNGNRHRGAEIAFQLEFGFISWHDEIMPATRLLCKASAC